MARADLPRPLLFEKEQLSTVCAAYFLHAQDTPQVGIDLIIADAEDELFAALYVKLHGDLALIQVHQLRGNLCRCLLMSRSALRYDLSRQGWKSHFRRRQRQFADRGYCGQTAATRRMFLAWLASNRD